MTQMRKKRKFELGRPPANTKVRYGNKNTPWTKIEEDPQKRGTKDTRGTVKLLDRK